MLCVWQFCQIDLDRASSIVKQTGLGEGAHYSQTATWWWAKKRARTQPDWVELKTAALWSKRNLWHWTEWACNSVECKSEEWKKWNPLHKKKWRRSKLLCSKDNTMELQRVERVYLMFDLRCGLFEHTNPHYRHRTWCAIVMTTRGTHHTLWNYDASRTASWLEPILLIWQHCAFFTTTLLFYKILQLERSLRKY